MQFVNYTKTDNELIKGKSMYINKVRIRAFEPKYVTITLETPNSLSGVEAEDMALKEFEEQYPEMVDPIIEEVTGLYA